MSERERFEAWARTQPRHEGASMRFLPLNNAYIDFDLHGAWLAWQAARSGQAASGSSQGARSDDQTAKRIFPPEPDPMPSICAGMTPEQVWEYGHLCGWRAGQPEAPTAAPLEPAAWADDRAIAGGIGNVVSAATKAYWERSHTIDRAMAARMVHPLYAHPPARSGAGSEEGQG